MIQQIYNNLYYLKAQKPSGHSILLTGSHNTLIDVGTREQFPSLLSDLQTLNLSPNNIHRIILTHAHYDHSGALEFFPTADVFASPLCGTKLINRDESGIYALKYLCELPTLQDFSPLYHLDIVQHEDYQFTIYHTGGHCEDSICLYEPNLQLLISGDTVFARGIPALITNSGSDSALLYSIQMLKSLAIKIILPGHGILDENPLECLQKSEKQILQRIQQNNEKIKNEAQQCSLKKYF